VLKAPEDRSLVPRHHLLGELILVLELVAALVHVDEGEPAAREQGVKRVAQSGRTLVHATKPGRVEPGSMP
jgi:hypothetical protein